MSKLVTIIIPTFNEERFIKDILDQLVTNKENAEIIETILVADGRSTDRTREIITSFSTSPIPVKLIDNPDKIQSHGLNHALETVITPYVVRLDAHAIYSDSYITTSVKEILANKVLNVGGAQRFIATNYLQASIALVANDKIGSGGANYRDESYSGPSETVWLGCYNTKALQKVGGFSTDNGPNEDSELNIRLSKLQNEAIWQSADIKAWYIPRSNFFLLLKQYFQYGRSRCVTSIKHFSAKNVRGSSPFISVVSFVFLIGIALRFTIDILLLFLLLLPISLFLFLFVRFQNKKSKLRVKDMWRGSQNPPNQLFLALGASLITFIMIVVHAIGYSFQLLKMLLTLSLKY